jgi:hypothetical protein
VSALKRSTGKWNKAKSHAPWNSILHIHSSIEEVIILLKSKSIPKTKAFYPVTKGLNAEETKKLYQ